jgi:hypothetical protein
MTNAEIRAELAELAEHEANLLAEAETLDQTAREREARYRAMLRRNLALCAELREVLHARLADAVDEPATPPVIN